MIYSAHPFRSFREPPAEDLVETRPMAHSQYFTFENKI